MLATYQYYTGMAGKDELAGAVLGGADDYISDIVAAFSKMFYVNDEERVTQGQRKPLSLVGMSG